MGSKGMTFLYGFILGAVFLYTGYRMFTPDNEEKKKETIDNELVKPINDTLKLSKLFTSDLLTVDYDVIITSNMSRNRVKQDLKDKSSEHSAWWIHQHYKDSIITNGYEIIQPIFSENTERLIADYYEAHVLYIRARNEYEFTMLQAEVSNKMVNKLVDSVNQVKNKP